MELNWFASEALCRCYNGEEFLTAKFLDTAPNEY